MTAIPEPAPAQQLEPALYLVATPIGNLADCSPRALHVLREAAVLMAEDTRHSRKLLAHFGIDRPCQPCHEHNEAAMVERICAWIRDGRSCAFISDAGTPAISDPGFRIVRACRACGLPVIPIPGPNAAIAALCASGLPTDQFRFVGFLPPKRAARLRTFSALRDDPATLIFFESTHRIAKFLDDALEAFGPQRTICVAREITKKHEAFIVGTLDLVRAQCNAASQKGEFVVLVAKADFTL